MATYVVLAKFTDTRASAMLPETGRCFQGNGENIRGHCCSNGDVLETRFRVSEDGSDQWQYLKDGEWKIIPPD